MGHTATKLTERIGCCVMLNTNFAQRGEKATKREKKQKKKVGNRPPASAVCFSIPPDRSRQVAKAPDGNTKGVFLENAMSKRRVRGQMLR